MRYTYPPRRRGFTLIELLVVMSIIAVLASLVLAATFKALAAGRTLEERDDIRMLSEGIAAFKAHFGVRHVPSYIKLGSVPQALDQDSVAYLTSLYPNPGFAQNFTRQQVIWNDQASGNVTLQGPQALVFFLGGPQVGGKPVGWSVNPVDPTDPLSERKIFANFRADRLRPSASGYLEYVAPSLTQPYAYFSPRWAAKSFNYQRGDCASLGLNPYGNDSTGFMNPDTFQIIGPGADGIYGRRGPSWTPQTAPQVYPPRDAGADDLSNFHGAVLGARQ